MHQEPDTGYEYFFFHSPSIVCRHISPILPGSVTVDVIYVIRNQYLFLGSTNNYKLLNGASNVFTVLQDSLALMNTSANRLMFDDWEQRQNRSQCIRCAVVGNGGILNGSKKGREIDQNDYVFR